MRNYSVGKRIALIAMFSALSFVLYLVNIPLPFLFPSFLEINLSDIPALIAGFALGPIEGGITVVIKILIKLPFSHTMYVGEFSDLLNGIAFVLPSSLIYRYYRTKKGAVISLVVGMICSVVTAILCNIYIMIPLFMHAFGMTYDKLASMCPPSFNITGGNFMLYYVLGAVIPFNVLRCGIAFGITFWLYKPLSGLINKFASKKN